METLCNVKHIMEMGGEAFSKIGKPNNTGTRIWCVSGQVKNPGYFEFECGALTLGEMIYDVCGGLLPGRTLQAVIPGGSSAKILRADERFKGTHKDGTDFDWGIEDIPLDFDGPMAAGTMSGSGGIVVMDNTVDMVEAMANINAFYAHESCGQCTPCREGSLWMKKISSRMCSGDAREEDADLLLSVANQIEGRTICAFGEAAAWPTQSFVKKFRKDFLKKLKLKSVKKTLSNLFDPMISTKKTETVPIVLDGEEVEVPAGINLVDAAALFKKEIPHYCYHPQLSVAGNCRMCLIEMGTPMRDRGTGEAILNEDGSPKIGWVPKPVIGCATTVSPGMHVKTISEKVTDCREGIMEFLLVNHPLDCPICDQAGECRLQEFATDYGRGYSRYVERKM